ncbi:MAG: DUF4097 family beta strand repeat protein [Anaerolineales bacterium]|nr:DUF4097 family beta strand repeat protein [Anaerolineales bacterium]
MKRTVVITLLIVALLFVLAGIGAVAFFSIRGNGGDFFTGRVQSSATVEESKTLKVDAKSPVTLNVNDDAGSVTVIGADVNSVQVKAVKTAHATTQARADEEVNAIKYSIEQTGNTVTLTYQVPHAATNFPNVNVFDLNVDTIDFVITVPNETVVYIESSFGDVKVSDIKGDVTIANNFGEVTVGNIEGSLSVNNDNGAVQAGGIEAGVGDINLHTGFGKVTLGKANSANITIDSNSGAINIDVVRATGSFSVNTDFGDTTFESGSAASLRIETNSGKVSITKVNISKELKVDNDFGEIELKQTFAGSYDLHTNSGGVTVDGAKNKLKAYTDFGNINIRNAQSVTLDLKTNSGTVEFSGSLGKGPHMVKSDFGGIDLALPVDSKLNVDLQTDFGNIGSDIPLTVTFDGGSDKNHQAGTMNGGGDLLTVITNSGGINITAIK